MEFNFDVQATLGGRDIVMVDGDSLARLGRRGESVCRVIDDMGTASARAQGLGAVITTSSKLKGSDQHLYLIVDGRKCLGLIKVGVKKLFIRDDSAVIKEISPLCVLDFYVHESCQRMGLGLKIYKHMCAMEGAAPEALGYDRPSHKFLSFLAKHYGLKDYVPQNNNFVVFKAYFRQHRSKPTRGETPLAPISARPLTAQKKGRLRGASPGNSNSFRSTAPHDSRAAASSQEPIVSGGGVSFRSYSRAASGHSMASHGSAGGSSWRSGSSAAPTGVPRHGRRRSGDGGGLGAGGGAGAVGGYAGGGSSGGGGGGIGVVAHGRRAGRRRSSAESAEGGSGGIAGTGGGSTHSMTSTGSHYQPRAVPKAGLAASYGRGGSGSSGVGVGVGAGGGVGVGVGVGVGGGTVRATSDRSNVVATLTPHMNGSSSRGSGGGVARGGVGRRSNNSSNNNSPGDDGASRSTRRAPRFGRRSVTLSDQEAAAAAVMAAKSGLVSGGTGAPVPVVHRQPVSSGYHYSSTTLSRPF